ncbi:MAG TPA: UDP-3-O-(3-hydroxymyristoyl)glucosamine N-acyltransferase [Beijerinckiaceae bacterium]|nr:UDP-3-O-(3-hydroxymyristoyl)glucosamine N-acyltransferase [Beijerinckiaceae bacterium]
MSEPVFFPKNPPLTLRQIAEIAGAALPEGADPASTVSGVAPLESAGGNDLAYMDNPKYVDALARTGARACLVSRRFAAKVPAATVALVIDQPYHAYAEILARLYPAAARPGSSFGASGVSPGSFVHPTARLEHGVVVDPGAVIGPGAEIGAGTVVGAGAAIGPQVRIGRDCSMAAGASIANALIGNRVIIHPGARIGQDGFGYAMGRTGHRKVPQVGRVIIQDGVEIGANTTIDRGASRDTVIGEGTKIDNLVQIAHNVVIGRHCIIVAQVGISGSATLEDFVVLGGQVGVVGHVRIGTGAQIAGSSNVNSDVPPGARWGGTPAKPMRDWFREITTLKTLASKRVLAKEDETEAKG